MNKEQSNIKYFISITDESCKHLVCVGYVATRMIAEFVVTANKGAILDNASYAVIEKVKEGLFMYDENPSVYKVEKNENGEARATIIYKFPEQLACRQGSLGFGIRLGNLK